MKPVQQDFASTPAPVPPISAKALALLNFLRFVALACRAKPRADLFEACALLQVDRTASREAHGEALMRCLAEALGQQPRLYAPGTAELTFDEHWLIRLAIACAEGDPDSTQFLLASRVAHQNRRLVQFLMTRIAASFDLD